MNPQKQLYSLAQHALRFVRSGMTLGLGTGRAATAFVRALGECDHLIETLRCVPTSEVTASMARQLGLRLTTLDDVDAIDLTVDGADEVDPQLNLIKGYGGALVREKVVAAASREVVILVGAEKLVPQLGSRGRLPVEVLPFALGFCRRRIRALGFEPVLRHDANGPFVSDGHNHILDCEIPPLQRPDEVESALRAIPGVVGTGLFLGLAHRVLVAHPTHIEELVRHT
jgi:ribose 5-phosphate isomerase A